MKKALVATLLYILIFTTFLILNALFGSYHYGIVDYFGDLIFAEQQMYWTIIPLLLASRNETTLSKGFIAILLGFLLNVSWWSFIERPRKWSFLSDYLFTPKGLLFTELPHLLSLLLAFGVFKSLSFKEVIIVKDSKIGRPIDFFIAWLLFSIVILQMSFNNLYGIYFGYTMWTIAFCFSYISMLFLALMTFTVFTTKRKMSIGIMTAYFLLLLAIIWRTDVLLGINEFFQIKFLLAFFFPSFLYFIVIYLLRYRNV